MMTLNMKSVTETLYGKVNLTKEGMYLRYVFVSEL